MYIYMIYNHYGPERTIANIFVTGLVHMRDISVTGVHESSLPVAYPGYQVLSDILFRLGLIANALT